MTSSWKKMVVKGVDQVNEFSTMKEEKISDFECLNMNPNSPIPSTYDQPTSFLRKRIPKKTIKDVIINNEFVLPKKTHQCNHKNNCCNTCTTPKTNAYSHFNKADNFSLRVKIAPNDFDSDTDYSTEYQYDAEILANADKMILTFKTSTDDI